MQQRTDQTLLDAKKTQSTESSEEQMHDDQSQPQVAANQVNVHLEKAEGDQIAEAANKVKELEKKRLQYFKKGNHIANAAYKARIKETERSWLQSAGKWLYGAVGVIGCSMASYAAWLISRRCSMRGNYVAVSTVEKLLEEVVVKAERVPIEIPLRGHEAYLGEKEHSLLNFDNAHKSEGIEKSFSHNTDFSISGFALQSNLLLANIIVRSVTGERYMGCIGNFSLESQQLDRINNLFNRVIEASNPMTEEEWPNKTSAFNVESVSNNEVDTLFCTENLLTQDNDWHININSQKTLLKPAQRNERYSIYL